MKFKFKSVSFALGLCVMSGAALAQQAEEVAKPVVVPPPPAGKAEVVFFRATGLGSAISCAFQENGAKIASLPPGRFFVLIADAGHHAYTTASSGDEQGIFFDLKPGDIKYVGCHIVPGFWVGKADLEIPIRDDAFATKMWKQVTPDRIVSPNVLSAAQLAAAMAGASAPVAVSAPAPTAAVTPPATPAALAGASAPAAPASAPMASSGAVPAAAVGAAPK